MALEHSESYLRGVLAHIGLKNATVIRAGGIGLGPEARRAVGNLNPVKQAA